MKTRWLRGLEALCTSIGLGPKVEPEGEALANVGVGSPLRGLGDAGALEGQ